MNIRIPIFLISYFFLFAFVVVPVVGSTAEQDVGNHLNDSLDGKEIIQGDTCSDPDLLDGDRERPSTELELFVISSFHIYSYGGTPPITLTEIIWLHKAACCSRSTLN